MSLFRKAERKKAKLRLALCGASGSGKTYSAILIAKGLQEGTGCKIAMIDTENHSGELYSDLTGYDLAILSAPYAPEKYVNFIKEAEKGGYGILIIDSLSHAWAGEGGVLDMVDAAASATKSKNSYAAWRHVTPAHNKLVEAMLQSNMHIIVTIRAKTAYETSKDEHGKMKVEKLGLAPVQRDGLDYEFTTVLDLSQDKHIASASKDRTGIFDGKYVVPSEKTGHELLAWLNGGKDPEEVIADWITVINDAANEEQLREEFKKAYKDVKATYGEDSKEIKLIENAKNKRKTELLGTAA